MQQQDDCKLKLELFEGPLDLLLYLIKKEEVDIYNIPIEKVTTQYMEYLKVMQMLDLNIAGEFIVMAATLMMIKSRMLLPVEVRPELEQEEEDPRWELVRQLVEYKKFKDAASNLQEMEYFNENVFQLGQELVIPADADAGVVLQDVSIFDLITAFKAALSKARPDDIQDIFSDKWSVSDKIDIIISTIAEKKEVRFSSLFPENATKHEVICTFLALLELLKMRQIDIKQDAHFSEILICGANPLDDIKVDPEMPPEPVFENAAVAAVEDAEPMDQVTEHVANKANSQSDANLPNEEENKKS